MKTSQETKAQLLAQAKALRRRVAELEDADAERQQAQTALQVSETRYRRLFETAQDGILILNADSGQITDVNPFLSEMLGYAREEFLGKRLWEIGPFKDIAAAQTAFQELQSEGYIRYEDLPLERSDGRHMDVEFVSNVYRVDGQRVIQCNIRDITERKHHEREIESVAALGVALRNALTRGEMLPVIVSQVLHLLHADGAALLMCDPATSQSAVVLAGGNWTYLTGTRLPPGQGVFGHVITTGQPVVNRAGQIDPRSARSDLLQALQAVAGVPLIEQGQTIGAIWIGRQTELSSDELRLLHVICEITANALYRARVLESLEDRVEGRTRELAEANEHLQELDRLKDEFISNINHELRTPFANVKLYINLFERGRPEMHDVYLETLHREVARLEKIIEDLLDFSRLDQALTRVEPVPIRIDQILSWLITDRSAVAAEYGLTLAYEPSPNSLSALANPVLLAQVVSNLLNNAFHYTPAGGTVTVTCAVAQDQARNWAVVSVQDTGPGISAVDLPNLFERFYRGEVGRKSSAPGTGLGLAISKEIVERLGGHMTVDSKPGYGATFKVWLLLASAP
jgi:PAS domain S-box-containing protein